MEIRIVFENGVLKVEYGAEKEKQSRPGRGKSRLSILGDYTSLDLETTGFSPEYCEIIEIGCVRFRGGVETDSFSSLVKPQNMNAVDGYITNLTGITQAMLESAPGIESVLPQALEFIGSDIIVGHNVSFDINFVYDNAERLGLGTFGNDYIDTMRMSRKLFPEFANHKLKTLVNQFGISDIVSHRSEGDARQAALCYQYMVKHVLENNLGDKLAPAHGSKWNSVKAADIVGNPEMMKENSPLFGKTVVFTGTLEKMTRKEAMQLVADLGGVNGDTVTKKTDFLVLGNNDMCASIKDGKSSKQKKAEKYILAGSELAIISENVFYDMLSEEKAGNDESPVSLDCAPASEVKSVIPAPGIELSALDEDFICRLSAILQNNPLYGKLAIEHRSDSYLSVVIGYNDFLRFKYSSRAKWISLDLPPEIAAIHQNNPVFAAQKNKNQRHWKANISSLNDLDSISELINAACIDYSEE